MDPSLVRDRIYTVVDVDGREREFDFFLSLYSPLLGISTMLDNKMGWLSNDNVEIKILEVVKGRALRYAESVAFRKTSRPDCIDNYIAEPSELPRREVDISDKKGRLKLFFAMNGRSLYAPPPKVDLEGCLIETDALFAILEKRKMPLSDVLIKVALSDPLLSLSSHRLLRDLPEERLQLFGKEDARSMDPLVWNEYRYLMLSAPVEDDSPFIFPASRCPAEVLSVTDRELDDLLNRAVGGWLFDLDLSKTLITGSIVCAVLGYSLRQKKNVKLSPEADGSAFSGKERLDSFDKFIDVLYPRVYTEYGKIGAGDLIQLNMSLEALQQPDGRGAHLKNLSFHYRYEETEGSLTVSSNVKSTRPVTLTVKTGVDVDMPIVTEDAEEFERIARAHHKVVKKHWPRAILFIIKRAKGNLFRIKSGAFEDYFRGFRTVEMYMSAGRRAIISHHIAPVRCWKGQQPGLFLSASCLQSHMSGSFRNFHYFAGKDEPWTTVEKYRFRGFEPLLSDLYSELSRPLLPPHLMPSYAPRIYDEIIFNAYGLPNYFALIEHYGLKAQ